MRLCITMISTRGSHDPFCSSMLLQRLKPRLLQRIVDKYAMDQVCDGKAARAQNCYNHVWSFSSYCEEAVQDLRLVDFNCPVC